MEKASRMEELSQVYFSTAPAPEPEVDGPSADAGDAASIAFIPVWNMVGRRGGAFLRSLRKALEDQDIPSLQVCAQGGCFRIPGQKGKDLSGAGLRRRLMEEKALSVLLLEFHGRIDGGSCSFLRSGDLSLLLVNEEIPLLREAYANLKRMTSARGGTLPTVIPLLTEETPWSRIAPHRFAEAASRFLRWRLPVWSGGDPSECARRIGERLRRMRNRRERGMDFLLDRLSPLLEVAS